MSAIRQSFGWWCFAKSFPDPETLLSKTKEMGYSGVELLGEPLWPLARKHGLTITSIGGHGTIEEGMNDPANADRIENEIQLNIKKAIEWEIPILICFSGNRRDISDDDGLANCAAVLKRVAPAATEAGVTLAVELLNSTIEHPDYQCDHAAWGIELCRQVDAPSVKLLYDIYHMRVMEGRMLETIQKNHEYFGHYHTAGYPGRGQPDSEQEIDYPPIYQAIKTTGYQGFIGHEFLTKEDPLAALQTAFTDCAQALGE